MSSTRIPGLMPDSLINCRVMPPTMPTWSCKRSISRSA
jgi:hypothetical protein